MDDAARQLLETCHPHVPAALLAECCRRGWAFPRNPGELAAGGFGHVLTAGGWTGATVHDGQYIRFDCPACSSLMFQPNTRRGIVHALRVARAHKPGCCDQRAARYRETGVPAVWPDRLDE